VDRPQDDVVLEDEVAYRAPAVPPRRELEAPLDFYDKKASVSLTMLILFCMPSSYRSATNSSREMTRAFFSRPPRPENLPRRRVA